MAVPLSANSAADSERQIDRLCINTLCSLSRDAIQKADCDHPQLSRSLAPIAYCLWKQFLRFDPEAPRWMNRDRFILSNGQHSMLLYALLHLCQVKAVSDRRETTNELAVALEDIKKFRQPNSRCTGHPEYGLIPGIEATTGPPGQGVSMSVGMAIAQEWSAQYFNRPGFSIFNYNTYALCDSADIMAGISGESASIAGHLKLSNLCWIYDNNSVATEENPALAFSEDVESRFTAYGWCVLKVSDADSLEQLLQAFTSFQQMSDCPTLIVVDSSSKQRSLKASEDQKSISFQIPDGIREHFEAHLGLRSSLLRKNWDQVFEQYQVAHPHLAAQLYLMQNRELPEQWDADLLEFPANAEGVSGCAASAEVLNAIAAKVPWILGSTTALNHSISTPLTFAEAGHFTASSQAGRTLYFGVREQAMSGILNGLSLSKIRPFGSALLAYSDHCHPAIRLSVLMNMPVVYIFIYDATIQDATVARAEGITHQSIEQLVSLRAIPGLITLRPADANEVAEAWWIIMQLQHAPSVLILPKQAVPTLDRSCYASAVGVHEGAYILADAADGKPDVLLLSTGSEVALCIAAYEQLKLEGIKSRVVSMPSWELFEQQSKEYHDYVLPPEVRARVSVESASTLGWAKYVGLAGKHLGVQSFQATVTPNAFSQTSELTVDKTVEAARSQLSTQS